jgi:hypothetical protein
VPRKKKTVGERVAAAVLPCVNVWGNITVSVPYEGRLGMIPTVGQYGPQYAKAEAVLNHLRGKIARYVDRIAKARPRPRRVAKTRKD